MFLTILIRQALGVAGPGSAQARAEGPRVGILR